MNLSLPQPRREQSQSSCYHNIYLFEAHGDRDLEFLPAFSPREQFDITIHWLREVEEGGALVKIYTFEEPSPRSGWLKDTVPPERSDYEILINGAWEADKMPQQNVRYNLTMTPI